MPKELLDQDGDKTLIPDNTSESPAPAPARDEGTDSEGPPS